MGSSRLGDPLRDRGSVSKVLEEPPSLNRGALEGSHKCTKVDKALGVSLNNLVRLDNSNAPQGVTHTLNSSGLSSKVR